MDPLLGASLGLQAFGMFSGAIGAKAQAQAQKDALAHNAQMDVLNARSSALSLTGQADLEALNAQSVYNTSLVGAEFAKARVGYEADAATTKAGYQANAIETNARGQFQAAEAAAGMNEIAIGAKQADANSKAQAYEFSAQADDLQARLNELQAQYMAQSGIAKEQDTRMQFAIAKSKARARMAAGNIDLGQGAALQVATGADVMAENASIRIQQETLMAAFGQRSQAQGNLLSAAAKRSMASGIQSGAAMDAAFSRASTALNMSRSQLSLSLAQGEAGYIRSSTAANTEFARGMASAEYQATQSLAAAGLLSANANIDYKRNMSKVMVDNASAAAMVKSTMADGINPNMAMMTSLLGSAGQLAGTWYQYSKSTSRP